MVIHWETSKRPLFVKTIWKNGQHHVVLYENDTRSRRQSSRRSCSSTVSRDSFDKLPINNANDLEISTVKLLLTDIKDYETKSVRDTNNYYQYDRNPVTINIIPGESIKYKNFTNITFKQTETPTVEYNKRSIDRTPEWNPTINHQSIENRLNSNLTERVMVWLDLATQNYKKIKNERKKRTTTAPKNKLNSIDIKKKIIKHKPNYYYDETIDGDPPINDQIFDKNQNDVAVIQSDCDKFDDFGKSKRQLHIFLPNLPNKISEFGSSTLSSKSSSLLR